MSSNFSIDNNSSQWKNNTSYFPYNYANYYINQLTVNVTFAVAGTAINVWFLAAMLLSREIRSRMRNKIICGMLVVNLTESVILCSIYIVDVTLTLLVAYNLLPCHVFSVYDNLYHIQDFIGNWYIVFLLCVFATQALNFEPRFTRQWKNILTAVMFISPGVFALFFVPLTMHSYFRGYSAPCILSTLTAVLVYKCVDTIVPHTLAILLLAMTAVLKRRRYSHAHSSDALQAQLIDDRSQMEPLYPFVALLVTVMASDICQVVFYMNPVYFYELEPSAIERLFIFIQVVTYLRLVVVPLVLLLFPDIRERIKTWRPCRRSLPPVDLVVTYEKDTS